MQHFIHWKYYQNITDPKKPLMCHHGDTMCRINNRDFLSALWRIMNWYLETWHLKPPCKVYVKLLYTLTSVLDTVFLLILIEFKLARILHFSLSSDPVRRKLHKLFQLHFSFSE